MEFLDACTAPCTHLTVGVQAGTRTSAALVGVGLFRRRAGKAEVSCFHPLPAACCHMAPSLQPGVSDSDPLRLRTPLPSSPRGAGACDGRFSLREHFSRSLNRPVTLKLGTRSPALPLLAELGRTCAHTRNTCLFKARPRATRAHTGTDTSRLPHAALPARGTSRQGSYPVYKVFSLVTPLSPWQACEASAPACESEPDEVCRR